MRLRDPDGPPGPSSHSAHRRARSAPEGQYERSTSGAAPLALISSALLLSNYVEGDVNVGADPTYQLKRRRVDMQRWRFALHVCCTCNLDVMSSSHLL